MGDSKEAQICGEWERIALIWEQAKKEDAEEFCPQVNAIRVARAVLFPAISQRLDKREMHLRGYIQSELRKKARKKSHRSRTKGP